MGLSPEYLSARGLSELHPSSTLASTEFPFSIDGKLFLLIINHNHIHPVNTFYISVKETVFYFFHTSVLGVDALVSMIITIHRDAFDQRIMYFFVIIKTTPSAGRTAPLFVSSCIESDADDGNNAVQLKINFDKVI